MLHLQGSRKPMQAATLSAAGAACAQDEGEVCAFALSLFIRPPNAMQDPWSLLLDQQPRPPPIPEVSCRCV